MHDRQRFPQPRLFRLSIAAPGEVAVSLNLPPLSKQRHGGACRTAVFGQPGYLRLERPRLLCCRGIDHRPSDVPQRHFGATIPGGRNLPGASARIQVEKSAIRRPLNGWTQQARKRLASKSRHLNLRREDEPVANTRTGRFKCVPAKLQCPRDACRRVAHDDSQRKRPGPGFVRRQLLWTHRFGRPFRATAVSNKLFGAFASQAARIKEVTTAGSAVARAIRRPRTFPAQNSFSTNSG